MEAGSSKLCSVCPPLFFMTVTDGVRQELFVPVDVADSDVFLDIFISVMIFRSERRDFIVVKAFINGEFAASVLADILLSGDM